MDWWSLVDLSAYAVHLHEDNVKVEVNCSLLGGWIYFPTIETSARTVASLARTHARARAQACVMIPFFGAAVSHAVGAPQGCRILPYWYRRWVGSLDVKNALLH